MITLLKARAQFFLAGTKEIQDEGGGRALLGDNTGGGAVMLRPIRRQWSFDFKGTDSFARTYKAGFVPTRAGPSGT